MRGDGRVFAGDESGGLPIPGGVASTEKAAAATDEKVARKMLQDRLSIPTRYSITVRDLARRPDLVRCCPTGMCRRSILIAWWPWIGCALASLS